MCRCVRVGGSGCMLGGRPWAASAGPPAAEIFPPFQILYPRSYTQICCAIFLWSHLSVENRSLVDFKQINEAYGGDLHENGCFIEGKRIATRRTLAWWHSSCSFICLKSNIGRFQTDKWTSGCAAEAFICLKSMFGRFQTDEWSLWGRSSWKWLFYWRKTRCALIFLIYTKKHAEIEFYLHKDFCAAGIEFYLHKDFRAAEIEFYLHKEFLRKINEYIWKCSALRAPIC